MSVNRAALRAASSSTQGDPASRVVGRRKRLPYLDDLKVGLVAVIIAGHAVIGYTTGDWTYQEVQETTVAPALETVFTFCGSRWAAPRSPTSSRGSGRSTWRCSGSAF